MVEHKATAPAVQRPFYPFQCHVSTRGAWLTRTGAQHLPAAGARKVSMKLLANQHSIDAGLLCAVSMLRF
jgi:hypothetical protein